ncbi:hypothetical protein WJX72_008895 [[Myrmecia] bisecta]|uniref:C6H2-type domain-containing protein n=1 Tax=[Myrmecia] bisecta TaxID=41462 RepID=A0AAW1Q9V6_9CHLO
MPRVLPAQSLGCQSPSCSSLGVLQCLQCEKLGHAAAFCTSECFKSHWASHSQLLKGATSPAAEKSPLRATKSNAPAALPALERTATGTLLQHTSPPASARSFTAQPFTQQNCGARERSVGWAFHHHGNQHGSPFRQYHGTNQHIPMQRVVLANGADWRR